MKGVTWDVAGLVPTCAVAVLAAIPFLAGAPYALRGLGIVVLLVTAASYLRPPS